eukprot:114958-Rhodomonas_salina.1
MSQRLALPQHLHALEPRAPVARPAFSVTMRCLGKRLKSSLTQPSLNVARALATRTMLLQLPIRSLQLFAHPHSHDHPPSRPKNSQQSWRQ